MIPQKGLPNQIGEVLSHVEAREEILVTASSRPSVELRPAASRRWLSGRALREVVDGPASETLAGDLDRFGGDIIGPFTARGHCSTPRCCSRGQRRTGRGGGQRHLGQRAPLRSPRGAGGWLTCRRARRWVSVRDQRSWPGIPLRGLAAGAAPLVPRGALRSDCLDRLRWTDRCVCPPCAGVAGWSTGAGRHRCGDCGRRPLARTRSKSSTLVGPALGRPWRQAASSLQRQG